MAEDLTLQNARSYLERTRAVVSDQKIDLDLAGLTHVDSSALAVLLALAREAPAGHRFHNPPESLSNLARLYGVDQFLFPANS